MSEGPNTRLDEMLSALAALGGSVGEDDAFVDAWRAELKAATKQKLVYFGGGGWGAENGYSLTDKGRARLTNSPVSGPARHPPSRRSWLPRLMTAEGQDDENAYRGGFGRLGAVLRGPGECCGHGR